jgi:phage terminase small subunit
MQKLTPKQEAFALAYLETGSAAEAYRRAYNAAGSTARTVEKRAAELMKHGGVTGRIAELQAKAAKAAIIDRAWVLKRLMLNAQIAMGEIQVKQSIAPRKGKDDEAGDDLVRVVVEVYKRDGAVANRALELLGKVPEVNLFINVLVNVPRERRVRSTCRA